MIGQYATTPVSNLATSTPALHQVYTEMLLLVSSYVTLNDVAFSQPFSWPVLSVASSRSLSGTLRNCAEPPPLEIPFSASYGTCTLRISHVMPLSRGNADSSLWRRCVTQSDGSPMNSTFISDLLTRCCARICSCASAPRLPPRMLLTCCSAFVLGAWGTCGLHRGLMGDATRGGSMCNDALYCLSALIEGRGDACRGVPKTEERCCSTVDVAILGTREDDE
mmetsp:Transcript_43285/g.113729  ORF Transcript_43285/g.113729 Transcript_43285/m.113729 type:complete len:222 (-) Transcript_43285:1211-1876(-)